MKINVQSADSFINQKEIDKHLQLAVSLLKSLKEKTGKGSDYLGWMDVSSIVSEKDIENINRTAKKLQQFETVVVIGIGGSFLGSKSVVDLFKPYFKKNKPEIVFAGQNLDEVYIHELLDYLKTRNFGAIVISKSGTTLEPALGFRFILQLLINQFGETNLKDRVVAITDESKGALRSIVKTYQLDSFIVPEDVGGRYSVLSPVGLLPIAVAGINIITLLAAAKNASILFQEERKDNPAVIYATYRNMLYQKGFTNEIMVYSMPKWNAFSEWWKQLFGESEGKEQKGIFPISMNITTDLHSLGQYVQEGKRNLFETFISFKSQQTEIEIQSSKDNYDGLNYLAGKSIHFVNQNAEQGTIEAHRKGGVPIFEIELKTLDVSTIGELIYFFEISCAISGYLMGINPFDQPGVEAYKLNMFRLLGK